MERLGTYLTGRVTHNGMIRANNGEEYRMRDSDVAKYRGGTPVTFQVGQAYPLRIRKVKK